MVVKVRISAPERADAEEISDHLTEKQIVAGTLITSGDSRYHWEGEIVEREYFNI